MRYLISRTLIAALFASAFLTVAPSPESAEAASPVVAASAPSGMIPSSTPTAAYTVQDADSDIDRVLCAVDPPLPINPPAFAGFTPCPASPYALPALADGAHSFFVVAQDRVGNYGYDLRYFSTDATGPAITIRGVVEGQRFNDAWPPISVIITDPGTGLSSTGCAYDGATPSGCSGPSFVNQPLADGDHTLNVSATDGAGNVSSRSVRFSVEVPGRWKPSIAIPKKAKFKVKRGKLKGGRYATIFTVSFALPAGSTASTCSGTAKFGALAKKKRVATARPKFRATGKTCVATASAKVAKRFKGKKLSLALTYTSGPIRAFTLRGTVKL